MLFFRCVTISSLAFSADSLFLAASSNTETVHVFKLEKKEDRSVLSNARLGVYLAPPSDAIVFARPIGASTLATP